MPSKITPYCLRHAILYRQMLHPWRFGVIIALEMKGKFLVQFATGILSLLWVSCANIMAPDGGARDERPPVMRDRSMKDSALNFHGGTLEFEFDEFIKLNDLQNQLLVTPLLKNNPRVKAHKRTLRIEIDDSLLQANTTYSISLGNAVLDLREGNAYPNLGFTFSTGAYFDSLSLHGMLIEANTGKPDTSSMVLLYPAGLNDSAFFLQKPLYVQKSEAGHFQFRNLPARPFTIYALRDKNKNLRYDIPSEQIAYQQQSVQPGDSNMIVLYSFEAKDTKDTISSKLVKRSTPPVAQAASNKLVYFINVDTTRSGKRVFGLKDSLILKFNRPLVKLNVNDIRLYQDSVLDASAIVSLDSARQTVVVLTQWTEDALYKVELKKGFGQDSSGLQASASEFYFRTKRRSDYGFLTIRYTSKGSDIIELLRGEDVIMRNEVRDSLTTFDLLQPDAYRIRIVHDANKNGKWDTGSFFPVKSQPERVELFPSLITIKANWENKIDVNTMNAPKTILKK